MIFLQYHRLDAEPPKIRRQDKNANPARQVQGFPPV
jgi:hypothetical protein